MSTIMSSSILRPNLDQWNAVALWAWDIVVDNCAICRNHIMDLCEYILPYQPSIQLMLLQALNAKQIKVLPPTKSALSLGEFATYVKSHVVGFRLTTGP